MLVNINIRKLTKVLLARAAHFNQSLTLCRRSICDKMTSVFKVCLQVAIKQGGEEEEEEVTANKTLSLPVSAKMAVLTEVLIDLGDSYGFLVHLLQ